MSAVTRLLSTLAVRIQMAGVKRMLTTAESASLWRKISLYALIPGGKSAVYSIAMLTHNSAIVFGVYMYRVESAHHHHQEHIIEENDGQLPERPDYDYLNMKRKNFPWGQQSLFFNPKVNYPAPEM